MVFVQGHNTDKTKYLPKGTYKEGSTIDAMRDATVRPDIPLPDGACIFCRRITASHRACRSCKEVDFVLNTPQHAEYLASIHDIVLLIASYSHHTASLVVLCYLRLRYATTVSSLYINTIKGLPIYATSVAYAW